jgi:hypothetical protein
MREVAGRRRQAALAFFRMTINFDRSSTVAHDHPGP